MGGGGGGGGVAFYDDRLCYKIVNFFQMSLNILYHHSSRKLYPGARMHRRANHYLQYRRFVYLVLVAVRILPVFHPFFDCLDKLQIRLRRGELSLTSLPDVHRVLEANIRSP